MTTTTPAVSHLDFVQATAGPDAVRALARVVDAWDWDVTFAAFTVAELVAGERVRLEDDPAAIVAAAGALAAEFGAAWVRDGIGVLECIRDGRFFDLDDPAAAGADEGGISVHGGADLDGLDVTVARLCAVADGGGWTAAVWFLAACELRATTTR
ncbi:MAG TPA: hypothetical protein VFP72_22140 [Kineosporiaceae bacterium]|nr:hypothetical protein [Kineosporiaceae bacterium]